MAIELGLLLELKWTTDDIQDDKKGEAIKKNSISQGVSRRSERGGKHYAKKGERSVSRLSDSLMMRPTT